MPNDPSDTPTKTVDHERLDRIMAMWNERPTPADYVASLKVLAIANLDAILVEERDLALLTARHAILDKSLAGWKEKATEEEKSKSLGITSNLVLDMVYLERDIKICERNLARKQAAQTTFIYRINNALDNPDLDTEPHLGTESP